MSEKMSFICRKYVVACNNKVYAETSLESPITAALSKNMEKNLFYYLKRKIKVLIANIKCIKCMT